jgi:hypothetical protein
MRAMPGSVSMEDRSDRPHLSRSFSTFRRWLGMRGTVRLPGSKSISNRTLLLAALAEGDDPRSAICWIPMTPGGCSKRWRCSASNVSGDAASGVVRRRGLRRPFPGREGRPLPRQCGHRVPSADRGAGHGGRNASSSPACRACTSAPSAIWSMH